MLGQKASLERSLIAGLGVMAGYMLCGGIFNIIDPFADVSVVRFFSALTGLLFAAIVLKVT
jgi:hypothetical protein